VGLFFIFQFCPHNVPTYYFSYHFEGVQVLFANPSHFYDLPLWLRQIFKLVT